VYVCTLCTSFLIPEIFSNKHLICFIFKGVTLYVSNFERPLTERVQKDFFTEPSYASVTAVKTGPIEIADNIDKSEKGEPVFKESRSLLFKELRVQRIYDEEKKAVVYISFNTRLDKIVMMAWVF